MIHAFASQPNYWRHLAPVVDELRARGHQVRTWAATPAQPWGDRLGGFRYPEPVIVASWIDARRFPSSPVIYVEHGAGQSYVDGPPSGYAGAPKLDHVRLFLTPSEPVAQRWRAAYPSVIAEAVGCPALDQHLHAAQDHHDQHDEQNEHEGARTDVHAPIVAITSHWRCGVVPETMPALPLFERGISELARLQDLQIVGHAHPRAMRRTRALWDRLGIRFEVDPDVLLNALRDTRNGVLVADNTSLMYEAAAVGIPVLTLNAPSYRRDVEHGLRFWSHVPGLQCDRVQDLGQALEMAIADPPEARVLRHRAATFAYAHLDGRSSERAADVIERAL